ncbi:MAG: LamG-like jellyroll fold domain-containing protein [Verrucomicrobiota bacterium]
MKDQQNGRHRLKPERHRPEPERHGDRLLTADETAGRFGCGRVFLPIALCLFAVWTLSAAPPPQTGVDGLVGFWSPGPGPAMTVGSTPRLNLKPGFSIETRIRPSDLSDGRNIVFKDKEYTLRIDWPSEGSRISFYVYGDGQWEPRVSAYPPATNQWYHVVAAWDGHKSFLWVDGEPFSVAREAPAPAATDNPLCLGSGVALGAAFAGEIEYVRIYRKMLPPADILGHAYGIEPHPQAPGAALTEFDFSKGLQGWNAGGDASARAGPGAMLVTSRSPRGHVLRPGLDAAIGKKDFLSFRMALDSGTRGELIFVTTLGAGRIRFATLADGKPHTYLLEPWTWSGWGGRLLALGLAPSEAAASMAAIQYLRLTEQAQAEPELSVIDIFPGSTLPRAGRPDTIVVRIRNAGGTASNVQATLAAPPGVSLDGSNVHRLGTMGFQETREVTWPVQASRSMTGSFQAALSADGAPPIAKDQPIRFHARLELPKTDYVPEPVAPPRGRYTLWTHYCPLWKTGTHTGWGALEPWPEREPVLGCYNEGDPEVADWHIKYWLEHGITGVIYCWYRSNLNAPVTQTLGHAIHDGLLKARFLPRINFGIMWENGCGQGVGSTRDLLDNLLPFWLENYFSHPSYLRVDGKPVLYVWVPQNVTRQLGSVQEVRRAFDAMRAVCRQKGLGGLYLVGCVGTADRPTLETMAKEGWDASSAYGSGWRQPAEVKTVGDFVCAPYQGFIEQQEQIWKAKRSYGLLPDITAAMMGWDSRPWKETPFFWSDNTPEKFRDLCRRAKAVMDSSAGAGPSANTLIFCCWNEFGEGHYIEPTRGYGFDYLDVIRDVFTDAPRAHVDIAPADIGHACDSWYRAARQAAKESPPGLASWSGPALSAWRPMMGLADVSVQADTLRAVSNTDDPAWLLPETRIRASCYTRALAEMRLSRPGTAQLFWTTPSEPAASEAASVTAPVVGDGQFHTCLLPVGQNEHWTGCITSLRFDPTTASGVVVEIRAAQTSLLAPHRSLRICSVLAPRLRQKSLAAYVIVFTSPST